MLVERAGQVVFREEIHQHIWGNDTFVDFERAINYAINQIRAALGDDSEKPRFIETIPRLSYRFVCDVTVSSDGFPPVGTPNTLSKSPAEPTSSAAQPSALDFSSNQLIEEVPPTKVKRRPLYFGLAILGVAVATAATLALWRAAFRTPSPPKVLRFTRLTNDGQGKFGPMATDGSRIYFNELLPGRNLVVQVSVKGGEATSLPVPLALPVVLDLSRDGTELLVADSSLENEAGIRFQVANSRLANVSPEPQALWLQPVAGGSPHRIGTILAADARFGPSTTSIIYAIGHDISSVSEDGSSSRKILSIDDNEGGVRSTPFAFRFSPDARVFGLLSMFPELIT